MTRIHGRILSAALMMFCAYGDGRTAEYGLATNLPRGAQRSSRRAVGNRICKR
jgi:hypothetical protein